MASFLDSSRSCSNILRSKANSSCSSFALFFILSCSERSRRSRVSRCFRYFSSSLRCSSAARRAFCSLYKMFKTQFIKHFSCPTQMSMKFILLINVKMPITVGILTFKSRINFMLNSVEHESSFHSNYSITFMSSLYFMLS